MNQRKSMVTEWEGKIAGKMQKMLQMNEQGTHFIEDRGSFFERAF